MRPRHGGQANRDAYASAFALVAGYGVGSRISAAGANGAGAAILL